MNWPTSNPVLNVGFCVCLAGFVICTSRGGWLQWMADGHPAGGGESLTWRTTNLRYLNPDLYDQTGRALLRAGWRWMLYAGLFWVGGIALVVASAATHA